MRKIVRHLAVLTTGAVLIFGLPLFSYGHLPVWYQGADAVSGASVILAQPSGDYVVYINRGLHSKAGSLETWENFFSGGDFTYSFEDIVCSVPQSDTGAMDMAESYQSRLPENQMRVQAEDMTLLLSRLENGKFDVAILSKEAADAGDVRPGADTRVITVKGGDQ